MIATTSPNRVATYFDQPRKTLPPLPATPEARKEALADAVFAAVFALQDQLTHPDPEVVYRAATSILDFEKTRLRHGREVAGTAAPPPDLSNLLEDLGARPSNEEPAGDEPADLELDDEDEDEHEPSDPFLIGGNPPKDFGKFVRDVYQALVAARELGLADFVTVTEAEQVAELVVEKREAILDAADDDLDDG